MSEYEFKTYLKFEKVSIYLIIYIHNIVLYRLIPIHIFYSHHLEDIFLMYNMSEVL